MAILKVINEKESGRRAFLDTLEYVSNQEKLKNISAERASNFKKQTLVNRKLLGKSTSKRHFKQFVFSTEETWPVEDYDREYFARGLGKVARILTSFWLEKGYLAEAWIHHNTKHPHFHMILETCNAFDGKQLSQSREDLANLKVHLNKYLEEMGFNEVIRGDIKAITEDELFADGEDEWYVKPLDWFEEEPEECYDDIDDWNIGTLEHEYGRPPLREMVRYVWDVNPEWYKGREMVRIVPEWERRRGRVMVNYVMPKSGVDSEYNQISHLKNVANCMRNVKKTEGD